MELLEFKNKAFELFKITDAEHLPNAIMESGFVERIFDNYLEIVEDLSEDWLQPLFQYYQADRKEKMQDFTPKCLAKAVTRLVNTDTCNVCLDLCAGSGSLTIQAWENNKNLSFICKEFDERVIPILLFNLAIRNITAEVIHTDVLSGEVYKCYAVEQGERYGKVKEIDKQTLQADICISNPPYNMAWEIPIFAKIQSRLAEYTLPPKGNANWAFVLTALDEIKEKATFILPCGILSSNNNAETEIRKAIVNKNLIESVVLCPDNMFEATGIATCLITFNKNKKTALVEMIDGRKKYVEVEREQRGQYGGASHTNRVYKKIYNQITDEHITDFLRVINEKANEKDYCKSVSIEEIANNGYSLLSSKYFDVEFEDIPHRQYAEIVADINRIIGEKNSCKLTLNETLAKSLGFDLSLYKEQSDSEFNNLIEKISGTKIMKDNYFATTKNKNEIKFENANKENISSIFLTIFNMWKSHIHYLNREENRYLAELRDALLPDLMSGKIEV